MRRLSLRTALPAAHIFLRGQASRHGTWREVLWRSLFAGTATALLIWLALFGLWVATGPEWLGLSLEPLSLFLLPGFVLSVLIAGPHDIDPRVIVVASAVMYFVAFYWLLRRRSHQRAARRVLRAGNSV